MRKHVINHLMNGLTYIMPLLMITGLISLFKIPFFDEVDVLNFNDQLWKLVYPLFGAMMMQSIIDRPGIVLGLIVGVSAHYFNFGYVGIIVIGLITGYSVLFAQKWLVKLPISIKSLASLVVIPVVAGGFILGLSWIISMTVPTFLSIELTFLRSNVLLIISSIMLAAMMSYDLGGPINKVAFLMGVMSLSNNQSSVFMAAVMAGGMIPPLVIAGTHLLKPSNTDPNLIKKAKLNWLNGFSFLTEGAIPFIGNSKSKRNKMMISSGIAGLVIGIFQTSTTLPHGGIFFVWKMNHWIGFVLALVIGLAVGSILFTHNKNESDKMVS